MPLSKVSNSPPHPYAVWGAGLCLISGLVLLIGGPRPNSMEALMPTAYVYVWGASLMTGGALLIAAYFIRELLLAILCERAGCMLLATATLVYAGAAVVVVGASAAFPVGMTAAFGAASTWRAIQITLAIRAYRKMLRSMS